MHDINKIVSDLEKQLTYYKKAFFIKHCSMLTVSRNVSDQDKILTSYRKNIFYQTLIHAYY